MGLKLLQALSKVSKINYKMSRLLIGWLISFLRVREVPWVGLLPAGVLVDSSSFTRRVDHCKWLYWPVAWFSIIRSSEPNNEQLLSAGEKPSWQTQGLHHHPLYRMVPDGPSAFRTVMFCEFLVWQAWFPNGLLEKNLSPREFSLVCNRVHPIFRAHIANTCIDSCSYISLQCFVFLLCQWKSEVKVFIKLHWDYTH